MADVKIRVGASLDADMGNVFKPIAAEARKARQQMAAEGAAADKQAAATQLTIARDTYRENSRLNREVLKAKTQAEIEAGKQSTAIQKEQIRAATRMKLQGIQQAAKAEKDAARAAKTEARQQNRERLTDFEATVREMRRFENQQQRERVRTAMGLATTKDAAPAGGLIGYMGARSVVNHAGATMSRLARGAIGIGGSVVRGLGVDFDLSSIVRRNTEREEIAREIVNSAYQPGAKGAAGVRQDHAELTKEARDIGNAAAYDPTKVLQGFQQFTSITGDLETGRKVMGELALLSKATGSNIEHMAAAAGNAAAQIEDSPQKAAQLLEVMRAVASQGKLGAVEIRDLAVQMAKIAAQAPQFKGGTVANMKTLGAIAQEARQRGGAGNAAQAATAVTSFTNTFAKGARMKAFAALHIDPTKLTPEEIILQSLRKTKGNNLAMGKLFMDVQARKAVRGFENVYRDAHGTKEQELAAKRGSVTAKRAIEETKIAAVQAEFVRLNRVMLDEEEIRKEAAQQLESDASKAQRVQNQLDETGRTIQARLLPTLERLGPLAIQTAEGFGKIVEWSLGNPLEAVTLALVASVSKAAVGEMVARAIGTSVSGAAGGAAAGGIAGPWLAATAAIVGLGLAADQAKKLWNELHPEVTYAAGTSEEEKKRLSGLTKEDKQAEIAADLNKGALERGGYNVGKEAGPIDPRVADLIDPKKLIALNERMTKMLEGTLNVTIVNVDEIRARAGDAPRPPGPPAFNPAGVTNGADAPPSPWAGNYHAGTAR